MAAWQVQIARKCVAGIGVRGVGQLASAVGIALCRRGRVSTYDLPMLFAVANPVVPVAYVVVTRIDITGHHASSHPQWVMRLSELKKGAAIRNALEWGAFRW